MNALLRTLVLLPAVSATAWADDPKPPADGAGPAGAPAAAAPAPARLDRSQLVGTWKIIVFRDDGKDRLDRLGAGPGKRGGPERVAKLVITETECRVLRGDGRRETTAGLANAAWTAITLDASTEPAACEITAFPNKEGRPVRYLGIVKREGAALTICWNESPGVKKRPTRFESDGEMNLMVCERLSEVPEAPKE